MKTAFNVTPARIVVIDLFSLVLLALASGLAAGIVLAGIVLALAAPADGARSPAAAGAGEQTPLVPQRAPAEPDPPRSLRQLT